AGVPQMKQIELGHQGLDPASQVGDVVDQPEEAQILCNGEVAGQSRIDRREVRARERLGTALRDIDAADSYGAACRGQNSENHVDSRGLARAVGTQEPDDLFALDVEGDVLDSGDVRVALAQVSDAEHGVWLRRVRDGLRRSM